jgi:hypothetical protein
MGYNQIQNQARQKGKKNGTKKEEVNPMRPEVNQ